MNSYDIPYQNLIPDCCSLTYEEHKLMKMCWRILRTYTDSPHEFNCDHCKFKKTEEVNE